MLTSSKNTFTQSIRNVWRGQCVLKLGEKNPINQIEEQFICIYIILKDCILHRTANKIKYLVLTLVKYTV